MLWFPESYLNLSYKVSRISCTVQRFLKFNYIKDHTGYDRPYLAGALCHISLFYLKKHPREVALKLFESENSTGRQLGKKKIFKKILFAFLIAPIKGKAYIKFLFVYLTKPHTQANKIINEFNLSSINKVKNLFIVRFLLLILKLYELVINDILIKYIREFFIFLLDKIIILRLLFNIIAVYRKKEKINNIFYYELKAVVLINKKNDESKSLILKGD